MITSNISSNQFFSPKVSNAPAPCVTAGYKTSFFIPFTPFFIPVYTPIYLIIKHITCAQSALRPSPKNNYTPHPRFFENYTLAALNYYLKYLCTHHSPHGITPGQKSLLRFRFSSGHPRSHHQPRARKTHLHLARYHKS